MKQTNTHFWSHVAQFFLEWEMFQTKDVDLISSFRRVQNIVCFLLGNSPASDLFMEQIECSETSAYINQTPGNYPKGNKL